MSIQKLLNRSTFYLHALDWFMLKILSYHLYDAASVLDVGCGASSPLGSIKKHFLSEGIDIFKLSINVSKKNKLHDTFKIGDIRFISKYYKQKSFDAVIALHVIEHLVKSEADQLISQMEKIAKKKVIILTPNGYQHQHAVGGNPYQVHRSGWQVEDFLARGYTVRGLRGYKNIRGELKTFRYKPWFFWGIAALLSEPILYFYPHISHQLIAVKKLE